MKFESRACAGIELAGKLGELKGRNDVMVLGIPRGGIPVALPIAESLEAVFDLVVVRRLPIPWNPGVGFGSVTSTGETILNEKLIEKLKLGEGEIRRITSETLEDVGRRSRFFRGARDFPDLGDRVVVLVDDGIAEGYTMMAAIRSVRDYGPSKVIVAAPVSRVDSLERIRPYVDEVITLFSAPADGFAISGFYSDFRRMSDEEVRGLLDAKWHDLLVW